jgi:hypothetical protein
MRKSILLLAGVGIGAGFLYGFGFKRKNGNGQPTQDKTESTGASMGRPGNGLADNVVSAAEPEIDNLGTNQHDASEILKSVRDAAFDASDEKLALALGRPTEEIEGFTSGSETIDGDAVMKARTLAMQRGVEIQ